MDSTVSHLAQDANRATARWWSETMLEPGAACILDVETTGFAGSIIEIAVIDAATGETLLNTLVDPGQVPIEPGAQAVHGISIDDLVGAPTWSVVWDQLLAAVEDRTVLAYNAAFDRGRILHDCARIGVDPGDLASETKWQCIMLRRSEALGTRLSIALNGGHRALGDVRAARALLQLLAIGRPDAAGEAMLNARTRRRNRHAYGRLVRWIKRINRAFYLR